MPNIEPIVVDTVTVKQVASMFATGATKTDIVNTLGVTRVQLGRIMLREDFKSALQSIGDKAVEDARAIIRAQTMDLAVEVKRVLQEQLRENSLEAVKISLRVMGFDQQQEQKSNTNIQVVLPGAVAKEVEAIDVTGD